MPPRRILDAGCGTGKHSVYFAGRGYDVIGIDMSAGMIEEAAKNSTGLSINFALGDMRSLTFPSDFFDGVWTVAAIAHLILEDKKRFIQEAHRVLKHDGVLYISSQNLFAVKHLTRLVKYPPRRLRGRHQDRKNLSFFSGGTQKNFQLRNEILRSWRCADAQAEPLPASKIFRGSIFRDMIKNAIIPSQIRALIVIYYGKRWLSK